MRNTIPYVATLLPDSKHDTRIGNILVRMGKMRLEDIGQVLSLQNQQPMRFGEAACKLGLINASDVQHALACQFELPYQSPGDEIYSSKLVAAYQPSHADGITMRNLRTQLMVGWFKTGRKALAVVSLEPDENSSFIVANLAAVIAQLQKRTLVVDANLRAPRQHTIFELRNRQGLSDILMNRAGLEAIRSVDAFTGLSILPAGTLPPNPLEIISRKPFSDLTKTLADQFDVVLYDVPAVSAGSDAVVVAENAVGVVLCLIKNRTRLADIERARRKIISAGGIIIGSVVINP